MSLRLWRRRLEVFLQIWSIIGERAAKGRQKNRELLPVNPLCALS